MDYCPAPEADDCVLGSVGDLPLGVSPLWNRCYRWRAIGERVARARRAPRDRTVRDLGPEHPALRGLM